LRLSVVTLGREFYERVSMPVHVYVATSLDGFKAEDDGLTGSLDGS